MKLKIHSPWRFVAVVVGATAFFVFGDASVGVAFLVGAAVGSANAEFR